MNINEIITSIFEGEPELMGGIFLESKENMPEEQVRKIYYALIRQIDENNKLDKEYDVDEPDPNQLDLLNKYCPNKMREILHEYNEMIRMTPRRDRSKEELLQMEKEFIALLKQYRKDS